MQLIRAFTLFALLLATWLLLSGHTDTFLVGCGVVASLMVTVIAHRMGATDREGHPIHLVWRIPFYHGWLAWQIACSNVTVVRTILAPTRKLDPAADWVPASQKSTVGLVTFANSITLTPGTVSVSVESDRIYVHALSRRGLDALKDGAMDRRVRSFEGEN